MDNLMIEQRFEWLFDQWVKFKQKAIETDDYTMYNFFLKQLKKQFSQLYVNLEGKPMGEFVGEIIQLASCEMRENVIKYKDDKIPF